MPKFSSPSLPDLRTQLVSALDTCPDMLRLKQILARAVATGLWSDRFVAARVVSFCATSDSGELSFAHLAFDSSVDPTAFSYNAMIRGYSAGPTPSRSLHLFLRMLRSGLYPDRFAFPFLLRSCARADRSPSRGESLHSLAVKHGLDIDPHVGTSLLHAYASWDRIVSARRVFDEMPKRGTVTWNAIIACYARSALQEEGLYLFGEMVREGVHVNADTVVGVLSCCAGLGSLPHGKSTHGFLTRQESSPAPSRVEVGASLVHMYAKCGCLEGGIRVFERMVVRDASTWTAMIGGLSMHGRGEDAVSLFEEMVEAGLRPDSVTFTSVLHGCSHSGLIEEGIRVFNNMEEIYGVEAREEHFGAMVDLLGRAGLVEKAVQMVESMPFVPNRVVWGSLLHACIVNGELGVGERLGRWLLGLGLEGGFCVGVSNVYAKVGRWDEVGKVRERMVEMGEKKESGYSLVEVNGRVHKFMVGDTRHPFTMEIYRLLCGITNEMMLV